MVTSVKQAMTFGASRFSQHIPVQMHHGLIFMRGMQSSFFVGIMNPAATGMQDGVIALAGVTWLPAAADTSTGTTHPLHEIKVKLLFLDLIQQHFCCTEAAGDRTMQFSFT